MNYKLKTKKGFTLISAGRPSTNSGRSSDIKAQPHRGFTLMELLIAIAIIGILAGIGAISFNTVQEKGRDSKRKQELNSIRISLESYHSDFRQYPPDPSSNNGVTFDSSASQPWIPDSATRQFVPKYIKQLPLDPKHSSFLYRYDVASGRQTFTLWARLENGNDQEIYNKPKATCTQTPPPSTSYNYCVENP